MKQLKQVPLFILLALCAVLASCHKDKDTAPVDSTPVSTGLYVLNQGSTSGNSTLSYYDYGSKTVVADKFNAANGTNLGTIGNDVAIYGSKTYIVMNVSSNVTVINTKTGKLVKLIPFSKNGTPTQPRWVAFYKGNALVTAWDGTVSVIDTATLSVTKTIAVGANPEQLVVSNGKLYVTNSGGLQATYSNTVSVIDFSTLAVIKTLTVGLNPVAIGADAYNNVYVSAMGDYFSVPSTVTIINSGTDVAAAPVSTNLAYGAQFVVNGDVAYYLGGDNKIKVYNVKTQTVTSASFVTDGTTFASPYAMTVDPASGELFVADAGNYVSNGTVFAFDKNGKKEYSFTVGIIPGKIAIIKN